MAAHTNNTRTSSGIKTESIGEYSVTYGNTSQMPDCAATWSRNTRGSEFNMTEIIRYTFQLQNYIEGTRRRHQSSQR